MEISFFLGALMCILAIISWRLESGYKKVQVPFSVSTMFVILSLVFVTLGMLEVYNR